MIIDAIVARALYVDAGLDSGRCKAYFRGLWPLPGMAIGITIKTEIKTHQHAMN
jgi:hypothetical protein